jgi:hypothetical protein
VSGFNFRLTQNERAALSVLFPSKSFPCFVWLFFSFRISFSFLGYHIECGGKLITVFSAVSEQRSLALFVGFATP